MTIKAECFWEMNQIELVIDSDKELSTPYVSSGPIYEEDHLGKKYAFGISYKGEISLSLNQAKDLSGK